MYPILLSRLKHETAASHTRLENAFDLMRDDLQRNEYIALLKRFLGYVAPWENVVGASMPASLAAFFDARRKAPMLAADIALLAGHCAAIDVTPPDDLPALPNIGTAFGSMYVMEGSTLGGRFIAPHVARLLDLAPSEDNRHFDGYGAHTGSMWNAFRETVARHGARSAQYDDAVRAAVATFESLEAWLCREPLDAEAATGAGA